MMKVTSNPDFIIPNNQIEYGPKLGEGGFGIVYKGIWNYVDVAIKKLMMELSESVMQEFEKEVEVHSKLRNPYIVQIFGITETYGMVMEYMSRGSLRNVLEKNLREEFSWTMRSKIAMDMLIGLSYLHQKQIIHRDLKSLNVLLDDQYKAKLADFGLAKVRSEISSRNSAQSGGAKGTTQWMAPEIFISLNPEYTTKTDVFSFGIVLWELAAHEYPYKNANPNVVPVLVMQGLRETFPLGTPEVYAQLAQQCWDGAPDKRPTVDEAIRHLKSMNVGSSDASTQSSSISPVNSNHQSTSSPSYMPNTNQPTSSSSHIPNTNQLTPPSYMPNTNQQGSLSPYIPNTNQSISPSSLKPPLHGKPLPKPLQKPSTINNSSVINPPKPKPIPPQSPTPQLSSPQPTLNTKIVPSINPSSIKEIATLEGHTERVSCLAQLWDGTLASGSFDNTIKLWDPKKGNCLRTLQGHTDSVYCLTQLSDGTLASGSGDYTIKLWDPKTGNCLRTLEEHTKWVYCLTQLSDGTLASGSLDKTIKLWDPKKGNCLRTLEGHSNLVFCLTQLSDGTLASGSGDNTIKLWDPKTGNCLQTLQGHTNSVTCLTQLSDGTLASGSNDKTIKLWDPKKGNCLQTLQGHTNPVCCLTQLSDGTLASGFLDNTIKLWDPKKGKCLRTLQGHTNSVYCLTQLSDGTLASGSSDATIKLWK